MNHEKIKGIAEELRRIADSLDGEYLEWKEKMESDKRWANSHKPRNDQVKTRATEWKEDEAFDTEVAWLIKKMELWSDPVKDG